MIKHSDFNKLRAIEKLEKKYCNAIFYQFERYPDGRIKYTYISDNIKEFTGFSPSDIIEKPDRFRNLINEAYISKLDDSEKSSLKDLSNLDIEIEIQSPDKKPLWFHMKVVPDKTEKDTMIWDGILINITEKKINEIKQEKIKHELELLNGLNDITLHTHDENKLINDVCEFLVKQGNYLLCWVSFKPDQKNPEQIVIPNGANGKVEYLNDIKIDLNDSLMQNIPSAQVLLKDQLIIINDIKVYSEFIPWLEAVKKYGISSFIGIPFELENHQKGALNIYAQNIDAFDSHEISILKRIAGNLSQTITNIRNRVARLRTNSELNKRLNELNTIYQITYILENTEGNLNDILTKIGNVLPSGLQFPDLVEYKIKFNGYNIESENFSSIKTKISANIDILNDEVGEISIGYREFKKGSEESPFLREEINMLENIASTITVHFNKEISKKELIKSEANLKAVFEHTDVGYILLDLNNLILTFNNNQLNGFDPKSSLSMKINTDFTEYMKPEGKEFFKQTIQSVIESGKSIEYEASYYIGNLQNYNTVTISAVKEGNKNIIGTCITIKDITKRKAHEVDREIMTKELIKKNKELEQFTYLVSHNLKSPIVNILGLCELLKEEEISREEINYASSGIEASASQIEMVINDLNNILKLKSSENFRKSRIELKKLTDNILQYLNSEIGKSKAIIKTDFSEVQELETYKTYLESIFYNLISNSVKYAKPSKAPEIQIWTKRFDNTIKLHFKDNGIGIDLSKHKNEVFQLYKRFNKNVDGKGMGLFMVKNQVELMNGTIEIISEPDFGTEFIITFDEVNSKTEVPVLN